MENDTLVREVVQVLRRQAAKRSWTGLEAADNVIDSLSSLLSIAMYDQKYLKQVLEEIANST